MLERFIECVRRTERGTRILPNERSVWRLLGALLAEQHEVPSTERKRLDMGAWVESESGVPAGRMRDINNRRLPSKTRFRT